MTRRAWTLAGLAGRLLDPGERDAVLGDIMESGEGGLRALFGILGLAVRRQALLWRQWRPWCAAFAIALPGSLILMGASLAAYRAWRQGLAASFPVGVERTLLLAAWAWTGGRLVGSLSRRTLWASLLAAAAPCAFCLSRFRIPDTSPLSLLLFVIPAAWGAVHGVRSPPSARRLRGSPGHRGHPPHDRPPDRLGLEFGACPGWGADFSACRRGFWWPRHGRRPDRRGGARRSWRWGR